MDLVPSPWAPDPVMLALSDASNLRYLIDRRPI
jgi:hypothetical protein